MGLVVAEIPDEMGSRRRLNVVFEIEQLPDSGCPLGSIDGEIKDIRHQLVDDECHTDITICTDDCACPPDQECTEVVHKTHIFEPPCPCSVFGDFDCVPNLVDVVDGRFLVETYLSDRERLPELVESLKAVSDGLRLRQLKRIDTGEAQRSKQVVTLDLYEITENQREAVAKAVAEGYYSSPRETSIDELADEFGISTSALSQRLNTVESKLATAAFEQACVEE